MRPNDLALLRTPGVPTVSPDGRIAVVAVTRPDLEADEYRSQLWAVPTDASAPARPLTSGHRTARPRSPRTAAGWPTSAPSRAASRRLHVLPTAGGAAAPADRPPPGRRRAGVVAGLAPAGLHRAGARARAGTARPRGSAPAAEPPRLITTLQYRRDDVGFLADRRSQVFVARPARRTSPTTPCPPPEPVQVTTGDADCADVTWRPDGARARLRLRPARARRPRPRPRRLRGRARRLGPAPASPRRAGDCALPAYAPDGTARTSPRSPTWGRTGSTSSPGSRCPAGWTPTAALLEPLLDPELAPPRRRDAGDGRRRRRRAGRGAAAGRGRPAAGAAGRRCRRRRWSTGRSPCAASAAAGGVVVAVVAHDRSAGELIALTPGGAGC